VKFFFKKFSRDNFGGDLYFYLKTYRNMANTNPLKRNLLIIILCFNFFSSHSQNYWAKRIQYFWIIDDMYNSKSFVDSSGNLYVLFHPGYTPDTVISVSKFNNSGNLLWSYNYTTSSQGIHDEIYLVQSKDGLPAILIQNVKTTYILTLIKLDSQGNVIQTKSHAIPKKVNLVGIISTSDSGYLAYGGIRKF